MTPDELYRIVSDDPTYRHISTVGTDVMTTLKRVSQIVLFVLLSFPSVTAAQIVLYNDPSVFAGVDHIAEVGVTLWWDDRITQKTQSQFETEVRHAFELGVRRLGLLIDPTPRLGRSVRCIVTLLYRDGLVAYSYRVSYLNVLIRRDETGPFQEAEVWARTHLGTVGASRIDGRVPGQWCAELLELDWRTANPGD